MLRIRTMLLCAISVELILSRGRGFGSAGIAVKGMCISSVYPLRMLPGFVVTVWTIPIRVIKFLRLFLLILLSLPFKEQLDHAIVYLI